MSQGRRGPIQAQHFVPTSPEAPKLPGIYRATKDEVGLAGGFMFERGWRDMEGPIVVNVTGAGRPELTVYDSPVEDYAFAANDHYGPIKLHIPHDYARKTDLYIHTHWSHNGTDISGSLVIDYYVTYAKGHGQAAFHTRKQLTQTIGSLNITNTPTKTHRIDEIQLSTPGGSSTLLDTDQIEVDGLIIIHFDVPTIPTITGGAAKPFIHYVDGHYLADRFVTPQRSPDFYRYD